MMPPDVCRYQVRAKLRDNPDLATLFSFDSNAVEALSIDEVRLAHSGFVLLWCNEHGHWHTVDDAVRQHRNQRAFVDAIVAAFDRT